MRANATRKQYWYQHDGATCHVTTECLDFLRSKISHRILSRRLDHHWPANSPDLSPMEFSFWSQASNQLKKVKPEILEEMNLAVEEFAAILVENAVRKMCRYTRKRALAFIATGGHQFEHLM